MVGKETTGENDYNQYLSLLEKLKTFDLDKKEEKDVKIFSCEMEIKNIQKGLSEVAEDDYQNQLYLRGKLLSFYKKRMSLSDNSEEKMTSKLKHLNELKKQKEIIKDYKNDKNSKIPITKKLALTVQNISKTIEIFMKEKDIGVKAKKIIKDTVMGVTGSVAISLTVLSLASVLGPVFGVTDDDKFDRLYRILYVLDFSSAEFYYVFNDAFDLYQRGLKNELYNQIMTGIVDYINGMRDAFPEITEYLHEGE